MKVVTALVFVALPLLLLPPVPLLSSLATVVSAFVAVAAFFEAVYVLFCSNVHACMYM
jgi:hypothetical protein